MKNELKKLCFKILFQHLFGRTKENHNEPQSCELAPWLNVRQVTSQRELRCSSLGSPAWCDYPNSIFYAWTKFQATHSFVKRKAE